MNLELETKLTDDETEMILRSLRSRIRQKEVELYNLIKRYRSVAEGHPREVEKLQLNKLSID